MRNRELQEGSQPRCRGADSRARIRTGSQYRAAIKTHKPIASVRFHGSLYGLRVPSRDCHVASLLAMTRQGGARCTSALGVQSREGSCDFADSFPAIQPGTARLPRRFAPRNDTSGWRAVHQCPCAVEYPCTRRSVSAATDAIGLYVFTAACTICECLPEIATSLCSSQ